MASSAVSGGDEGARSSRRMSEVGVLGAHARAMLLDGRGAPPAAACWSAPGSEPILSRSMAVHCCINLGNTHNHIEPSDATCIPPVESLTPRQSSFQSASMAVFCTTPETSGNKVCCSQLPLCHAGFAHPSKTNTFHGLHITLPRPEKLDTLILRQH